MIENGPRDGLRVIVALCLQWTENKWLRMGLRKQRIKKKDDNLFILFAYMSFFYCHHFAIKPFYAWPKASAQQNQHR